MIPLPPGSVRLRLGDGALQNADYITSFRASSLFSVALLERRDDFSKLFPSSSPPNQLPQTRPKHTSKNFNSSQYQERPRPAGVMLSFFGGSSGTRLSPTSSVTGTKRKRVNIRAEVDPKGEGVHEYAPKERQSPSLRRRSRLQFNSSNQLPSRSADHNGDMATTSPIQNLLRLPKCLRNRILLNVLVSEEPYIVRPDGRIEPKPIARYIEERKNCWVFQSYSTRKPGILETCKTIREEARGIFYAGNDFEIRISAFNASAIVPWWRRRVEILDARKDDPITIAVTSDEDVDAESTRPQLDSIEASMPPKRKALIYQAKRQPQTALLPQGDLSISTQYQPHWNNLKQWLQLFHAGIFPALIVTNTNMSTQELLRVSAIFESIAAYKDGDEWETAEKGLEGHRKILVADDKEWSLPDGKIRFGTSVSEESQSPTLREGSESRKVSSEDADIRPRTPPFKHDTTPIDEEEATPVSLSRWKALRDGTRRLSHSHFSPQHLQIPELFSPPLSRSSRRRPTPEGYFGGMDPFPSPVQTSKKRKMEGERRVRGRSEEL
ncbi:uncharacterized protein MYCFIDRAFT_177555 [Pseudocercospora fijiensis CIRAD86]|uniref:Uncharacterized protein n=1 Tax=Pseudocercospora fijiensis (strain CIRAD86) TaxID=383855 RepID=M2YSC2_PSEFD|nr:uncharacterized protein MYCFIDRAFT_177555 [Pseudocercospora fijiensis CIRAD86]EME80625.1 hypothetical protein MYCFIDRAFT_177555 [Pseudocercospora fijiensis CIRAD86]